MLTLRCIHSSDSDSDSESDIQIDPEIMEAIKQQNDDYLFELEIKEPIEEPAKTQEESEYLCEINGIDNISSSDDNTNVPEITLKDVVLAKLFTSNQEIDLEWITKIRDSFNEMEPDEQHDVSYSLVTRLLNALQFYVELNEHHQSETENNQQLEVNQQPEKGANNAERHVSFDEGLSLLADSDDDELPQHVSGNITNASIDLSSEEDDEGNIDDSETEEVLVPTEITVRPRLVTRNNSTKRYQYNIPLAIAEEEEETKKAIRRLSRKASKWKRLARDRLAEIQRDIQFRDRMLNALMINQGESDSPLNYQHSYFRV